MQLIYGDCLEKMRDIPPGSVDMILCDLPYGVTARNKWDCVIPWTPLWAEYMRVAKENAAIVLTAIQPFSSACVLSNPDMFKYEWIWSKTHSTGFLNAKKQPLRSHEQVLVFYRKQPTYNPQKTSGHLRKVSTAAHKINCVNTTNYGEHGLTSYDSTERFPRTVLVFPSDKQKSALHPTQKPVALMAYLIRTYTNADETVLDNCMGSGTTGVACVETGRKFIGIELDPKYFQISQERLGKLSI
jgi:site-specific DNA-methyltransferase (adenine-specific)